MNEDQREVSDGLEPIGVHLQWYHEQPIMKYVHRIVVKLQFDMLTTRVLSLAEYL